MAISKHIIGMAMKRELSITCLSTDSAGGVFFCPQVADANHEAKHDPNAF